MIYFRRQLRQGVEKKARKGRLVAKSIDLAISLLFAAFTGIMGLFFSILYIVLSDSLFEGQSIGKKLVGLRVIDLETGNYCNIKQSIFRNALLALPLIFFFGGPIGSIIGICLFSAVVIFEVYLVSKIGSFQRHGDMIANTSVIANHPCLEKKTINDTIQDWTQEIVSPAPLQ